MNLNRTKMIVKREETITVTLTLTEEETLWLHFRMQNGDPEENETDVEIRTAFFHATALN